MDTQDFLRRVLGYDGHYCVFAARDGSLKQKFYSSIDQLHEAAQQFDGNGYDTYFALATFRVNEKGKLDRLAKNAVQLRSFFLDLDCGARKPFKTQAEAINSLKRFIKWTNLPKPTLVNSGNGVHVYWPLTEAQDPAKWQAAAERLKALCKDEEFPADPAITADTARVLRVPGSRNFKSDPPKPVSIIHMAEPVDFDEFVAKLPEPAMMFDTSPRLADLAKNDPVLQRLMGSKSSKFATIAKKSLKGEGCAQLKHVIMHQADVDEPMWRAALSIAQHCEDRDTAIHKISEKHPEYDPEQTEKKASATKGPYLCDKFDDFRPGVCGDCPLRGKIKSPIQIGSYVPDGGTVKVANGTHYEEGEVNGVNGHSHVTYSEIEYPGKYFRHVKQPGVWLKTPGDPDEDGKPTEKEVMVYHNDLYVVRRVMDPESGENLVWRLHLPKDEPREFTTPLATVTSREEFRKSLSQVGVAAMGKTLDGIMNYGSAWLHKFQEEAEADESLRQFGWVDYDKMDKFALGDKLVSRGMIEYNPPSVTTAGYAPAFKQSGTLDGWCEMMQFYNRPGMEMHQFIIGCCAGAPLMAMTPIHGALLSLHSDDSGYGKTTTSLAGLSIWGNPVELMSHEEDTLNSRMLRNEVLCNLPVLMDEVTGMDPENVSKMAYQIANGRQRDRLQSGANRARHRGHPWHTIVISTSNAALLDKLASIKMSAKGEGQRIMEYSMDKVVFPNKQVTDEFANKVKRNYGHVGVPLVQSYLSDMDKTYAGLLKLQKEVDTECKLEPANRFYSAVTASALVGLQHLQRLGLIDYDLMALKKWVIGHFIPRCLGNLQEFDLSIENIINEYLTVENYNSVLRIKSDEDLRSSGSGNTGMDQLAQVHIPDKQPGYRFIARYETDREILYLVPSVFKKWCADKQISYQSMIKQLQEGYNAKMVKMRLNKGTRFTMPPTTVWEIHMNLDRIKGGNEAT